MSSQSRDAFDLDPLPITVPFELHEAMTKAVGLDFAVSYLCGAVVHDGKLHPRTHTALGRLKGNTFAMLVLSDAKLRLGEPIPPEDRIVIPGVGSARQSHGRTSKW